MMTMLDIYMGQNPPWETEKEIYKKGENDDNADNAGYGQEPPWETQTQSGGWFEHT